MHEQVKETTSRRRTCSAVSCVESRDGTIVRGKEKMLERWEESIKELFEDKRENIIKIDREKQNLPFAKGGIEKTIKSMPRNKSAGLDDAAIELE